MKIVNSKVKIRIPVLIMLLSFVSSPQCALAIEVCGKFDTISVMDRQYIVQNNIWNAATAQCVSVADTSTTSFNVSKSDHNQTFVASYPSIFKGCHWGNCTSNSGMPILVNQITFAPFTWSVTPAVSETGNIAAEAWFSPRIDSSDGYAGGAELMIWLDYNGIQPAGVNVDSVNIGGIEWEVWYANSEWNYIAYRTKGINSVNLDLQEFIRDSVSRGYIQNTWYLHDLEAGTEIKSGGLGFATNSFSFMLLKPNLDTTLSGDGTGSINSNPAGVIACTYPPQSGTCLAFQPLGTQLTLTATTGSDSLFGGWGGSCAGCSGLSCLVTMDTEKSCTATFDIKHLVKIAGPTYFASIVKAYDHLPDGAVAAMQSQAIELTEDVDLNHNIPLTLQGGYDTGFNINLGYTTLNGILTLTQGSLTLDRFIVK